MAGPPSLQLLLPPTAHILAEVLVKKHRKSNLDWFLLLVIKLTQEVIAQCQWKSGTWLVKVTGVNLNVWCESETTGGRLETMCQHKITTQNLSDNKKQSQFNRSHNGNRINLTDTPTVLFLNILNIELRLFSSLFHFTWWCALACGSSGYCEVKCSTELRMWFRALVPVKKNWDCVNTPWKSTHSAWYSVRNVLLFKYIFIYSSLIQCFSADFSCVIRFPCRLS